MTNKIEDIKHKNAAIIAGALKAVFPDKALNTLTIQFPTDDSMHLSLELSEGKGIRQFMVTNFDHFVQRIEQLYHRFVSSNPDFEPKSYYAGVAIESCLLEHECAV